MLSNRQLKRSFSASHIQILNMKLVVWVQVSVFPTSGVCHCKPPAAWVVDSKPAVVLGPQVTTPSVDHSQVCITCQDAQGMSPPQCPLTGLAFSSCLKINMPSPFLQWCHCLGSGLRRSCRPRSLPPAPWAQGQAVSPIPFIDWCLWASFWDAPTAPAAELKILPCPSLFTPAGQGRTLIWTEGHFQGYGYMKHIL